MGGRGVTALDSLGDGGRTHAEVLPQSHSRIPVALDGQGGYLPRARAMAARRLTCGRAAGGMPVTRQTRATLVGRGIRGARADSAAARAGAPPPRTCSRPGCARHSSRLRAPGGGWGRTGREVSGCPVRGAGPFPAGRWGPSRGNGRGCGDREPPGPGADSGGESGPVPVGVVPEDDAPLEPPHHHVLLSVGRRFRTKSGRHPGGLGGAWCF